MIQYIILYIIVILTLIIYKNDIGNLLHTYNIDLIFHTANEAGMIYKERTILYNNLCYEKEIKEQIYNNIKICLNKWHIDYINHINDTIATYNNKYQNMNLLYIRQQKTQQFCETLYNTLKDNHEVKNIMESYSNTVIRELVAPSAPYAPYAMLSKKEKRDDGEAKRNETSLKNYNFLDITKSNSALNDNTTNYGEKSVIDNVIRN